MSRRSRGIAAAGYAVASFLSFPQAVGGGALDLGLVFAPLGPLLLILALAGLPLRRAAALGFAAGLAAHAAILHWIYVVTVVYGHGAPAIGVIAVLLLAGFVAGFTALFAAGAAWLEARRLAAAPTLAALWVAVDHLRGFAFTGFPWATLGYAWHGNGALLALVPWTGVYVLSFVAVLAGAGAADVLRGRPRRGIAALVAVCALHGAGLALGAEAGASRPETLRLAVLQGNIEQGVKWSTDWADRTWEIYASLTRAAVAQGARVVVWPETAVPGSPDADLDLRSRLSELARSSGATLVAGAVGVDGFDPVTESAIGPVRFYDSAFLIAPDGTFEERYDKAHLVPFGEYVPLRWLLGRFVKAIATGVTTGDVTAGAGPRALPLLPGAGAGSSERVSAGVPICYELLFPDLVRRFGGDGARVLLAITNDAWYGRTGAPYQFLAITAMRAAETRTWVARAANTGVSAFIDERGRVRERTRIFERDFLVRDVPLRAPGEEPTFYVRHGDVFAGACWLWLAGALSRGLWRRRTAPRGAA